MGVADGIWDRNTVNPAVMNRWKNLLMSESFEKVRGLMVSSHT
jgi:hypothetical protein